MTAINLKVQDVLFQNHSVFTSPFNPKNDIVILQTFYVCTLVFLSYLEHNAAREKNVRFSNITISFFGLNDEGNECF